MINWTRVLFGKPEHPYIQNLRRSNEDTIFFDSLTRGMLVSGNPGTGKTTWLAMEMIRYVLEFPERPVVSLDASGSLTNEFIELVYLLPQPQREQVLRRIVLDMPGHEEWVVPKPIFNKEDGLTTEEQVQKAKGILEETNRELLDRNPTLSFAIKEIAPEIFRLLSVIRNEYQESWQITEVKKLLIDYGQLRMACKYYGQFAPEAKWYFEKDFLREDVSQRERDLRSYTLRSALGVIEPRPLRARYGFYRPTITAREVIDKGLIYLVSGEKLANLESAQAFVFWDEFSTLRATINKRTPHNPADKPVLLVIDEVYRLFEIEGMAKALGEISTYFRSRGLMPIIVIQAYWQLTELLKEQIWNLGNIYSFAMENHKDAYGLGQQVGKYDSQYTKWDSPREGVNPTAEPDRGQYLGLANWIQNLKWRQMVMRRYLNEREKDPYIRYVRQTRDKPTGVLPAPIDTLKEELLKRYAVPVRDALREINERTITHKQETNERPTVEK